MERIFPPGGYFIGESDVAACVSGGGQQWCVHRSGGNRAVLYQPCGRITALSPC